MLKKWELLSILIILSICCSANYEVVWSDSFDDESLISEKYNINISGGNAKLLSSGKGYFISTQINAYDLVSWGKFYANSQHSYFAIMLPNGDLVPITGNETQETPDSYACDGEANPPCSYAVDGLWDTYTYCSSGFPGCFVYVYENYTIPFQVSKALLIAKFYLFSTYPRVYCFNYTSSSWVRISSSDSYLGEYILDFTIPRGCLLYNVLQIKTLVKNTPTEEDIKYFEGKVVWFYSINYTTAQTGINLSSVLSKNTTIYLHSFLNDSSIVYDWNITYYQSTNPCVDYDGGIVPTLGSNVSKIYVSYNDKCENSVLTEFYCDRGIIKSTQITCDQGCVDSTRCRAECINNIPAFSYHRLINASQVQFILFNFSSMKNYVKPDVSNIISYKQAWRKGDYGLIVNASEGNVVVYLSDDLTNISYSTTSINPNLTLQLEMRNFSRVSPFYEISFGIEGTWNNFSNDLCSGHQLYINCPTSGTGVIDIKNRNVSKIKIATSETPLLFSSLIDWDGVNRYVRNVIPFSEYRNITIYLLDLRNLTIVATSFSINDLTRTYNNAYLRLMKYVNGILTDMHSDWFGADKKLLAYLIDNHQYIIVIGNQGDINESRSPGRITATQTNLERTITLVPRYDTAQLVCPCSFINITYTTNYTLSQICLNFVDSRSKTEWANFLVYTSEKQLLYNYSATTPSSFSSCYYVPDRNASYIIKVHFSHPDCSVPELEWIIDLGIGIRRVLNLFIPTAGLLGLSQEQIYIGISLFLITTTALVFGAFFSGLAGISIAAITSLVYVFGWININIFIIATLWVLAIIHHLSQRRYIT